MPRLLLIVMALCCACTETYRRPTAPPDQALLRDNRHFAVAIYDKDGRLLNTPVESLRQRMDAAALAGEPYTDLFVIAHGWNFTVPEALANFASYIEGYDAQIHQFSETVLDEAGVDDPRARVDFAVKPLILFVAYDSIARPLQDLATSVLPLGVGDFIQRPLGVVDSVAFHLPSAWGESVHAMEIGLGVGEPRDYRALTYTDVREQIHLASATDVDANPWDREGASGAPIPLSMILRELMDEQLRRGEDDRPGFRLHTIGHSYGAKIIALASMEAVHTEWRRLTEAQREQRRQQPGTGPSVDTMLLFNPAMHLEEFSFDPSFSGGLVSGSIEWLASSARSTIDVLTFGALDLERDGEAASSGAAAEAADAADANGNGNGNEVPDLVNQDYDYRRALRQIERKAVIFSNNDFATGLLFDFSEIVVNKRRLQYSSTFVRSTPQMVGTPSWLEELGDGTRSFFSGVIALPLEIAYSVVIWATDKLRYLPGDFVHHVAHNDSFGRDDDGSPPWYGYVLNVPHFFLPLDQLLFSGRAGDEGGLTRYARPGLGQTGLYRAIAGREGWALGDWQLGDLELGVLDRWGQHPPLVSADTEVSAADFVRFADLGRFPMGDERLAAVIDWTPDRFYSFDASQVFSSRNPMTAGAHGDIRSPEVVELDEDCAETPQTTPRSKRMYTMDFILRAALEGRYEPPFAVPRPSDP